MATGAEENWGRAVRGSAVETQCELSPVEQQHFIPRETRIEHSDASLVTELRKRPKPLGELIPLSVQMKPVPAHLLLFNTSRSAASHCVG